VLLLVNDKASTYASAEQFFLSFVTHTILPWCVRAEQTYERDLVDATRTYYVKHNVDGLLRGDITARFNSYRVGIESGILSANEARETEDRNPRQDPGGDSFWAPINYQRTDKNILEPKPTSPSALVNIQGGSLADSVDDWHWGLKEQSGQVPIDLTACGRGAYTNGKAHQREERA
jgi:hypothetical protein